MKTFSVTDYKGCKHIDLSPSGQLVVIAGGNGAGKSSFIDAISELFDPHGTKLTPKPIREGADEARAEYVDDTLGLKISRVWKRNGTAGTLSVEALDGARYGKPSEVVAELTGGAIFDPVSFLNLSEKAQRDALLEKVDLPFDLDVLGREKSGAESRRLEAGREVKRLEGALSALPEPAPDVPDEEVSASDLISELRDAEMHNTEIRNAREMAASTRQTIAALTERLAAERESLARLEEVESRHQIDVISLRARLNAVEDTNSAVRAARQYFEVAGELQVADAQHAAAQAELDAIDRRKADGLARAVFPVDGLSVDDDGVTFDGIPFGQVNTASRMRVAFGIATAGDPKLKLVIVRNGDLLDSDSLTALANMAEERGYTVLVERDRDQSRQIGFTISDGVLA